MLYLRLLVGALALSFLSSCLPSRLKKYQKEPVTPTPTASQDVRSDVALAGKMEDARESAILNDEPTKKTVEASSAPSAPAAATVYPTGKDTFRFELAEEQVWDSLLNIVLRNYNIALLNREQGLITTEWDSYYLNNTLYRNKISARLIRTGRRSCELLIHNNVEQASDLAGQQIWVPGQDGIDEPLRIVKNIAILLEQPPPQAQPSNVARDLSKDVLN